jgi:flagellar protein FlgJ
LAQAALESGWGKKTLKAESGADSYNLFNIKAGSNWTGPVVSKEVVEYKSGLAVKSTEKFRVYGSYEESFADYARLISSSPRYTGVLNQDAQGFATGLQQSGYATDPSYAGKIMRLMNSPTFRQLVPGDSVQTVG